MKIYVIFGLFLLTGCHKTQTVSPDCVEQPVVRQLACIQVYAPVCGCNGKTYSNSCEAELVGIMRYTPGACGK